MPAFVVVALVARILLAPFFLLLL